MINITALASTGKKIDIPGVIVDRGHNCPSAASATGTCSCYLGYGSPVSIDPEFFRALKVIGNDYNHASPPASGRCKPFAKLCGSATASCHYKAVSKITQRVDQLISQPEPVYASYTVRINAGFSTII